ncbi:hypothetical protein [[Mycobacterium] wendilense]|uniref:Uncharacterized protein n=1 Tax=[Mycobacterium] wendilense TaxID=3064284 RepID=A0ABN9P4Q4_9MYCO|nr:hypothetical protein [Mycolicibacterium sp. MU0050]CAJ1587036.1 hypothetical protein MU0050_004580 [Mycolicibacterium sp. MU0050]
MNTVLYYSVNGAIYETNAYTAADIDRLIRNQGLQSLTSADRELDFWFSSSPQNCQRRINRNATELLLATTNFDVKTVPLLRGCVVVATHDGDGDLDGLSWQQLERVAERHRTLSQRERRALNRRILRSDRRHRDADLAQATFGRLLPALSRP